MVEPRGPLLYYNISVKHPGLFQDFRKPVSASLNCQNSVCLCNRVNFSSCACSGSIRLGSTRASLTRPGPSKVSACHIFVIGNLSMADVQATQWPPMCSWWPSCSSPSCWAQSSFTTGGRVWPTRRRYTPGHQGDFNAFLFVWKVYFI